MFTTYNSFIKALYNQRCQNPKIKAIYQKAGGFKAFKKKYIYATGFSDYLISIRGAKLTSMETYHLAKMFAIYGKRASATLPNVLAGTAKQYDLEFPSVNGILSKEYWQSRFDDSVFS